MRRTAPNTRCWERTWIRAFLTRLALPIPARRLTRPSGSSAITSTNTQCASPSKMALRWRSFTRGARYTDPSKHETSIKSFKLPFGAEDEGLAGNTGIVIVNNMLLTGFDAPVEQVMYLDKIVIAHSLLQAIARVNRVSGPSKDKGFVVDYVGVGHHLKKALDAYDEREQNEVLDVLSFPEEALRELEASHAAIMDFLKGRGLADLADHDAFFDLFYDEDLRFEYVSLF